MRKFSKFSVLGVLALGMKAEATNIQTQMEKAYKAMGYETNASDSSAFSDQQAGYYTGGSFSARKASMNSQLVSMHLPSPRMGCGGIDLYLGGFSYISKAEFVRLLRNIAASSGGYAFQLSLQSTAPMVKGVIDQLQSVMQEINNTNISSCEAGAALVGGIWPRSAASQDLLCKQISTGTGKFSDWASAKQGCRDDLERNKALSTNSKEFEDIKPVNINLAWRAMQKNGSLNGNNDLKELFMSVSGSIVIDGKGQVSVLPSKVKNPDFIKGLLQGGKAIPSYKCKEAENCLSVSDEKKTIPESKGLVTQIRHDLAHIKQKIKANSTLSDREKGLINSTPIPILKIILIELAFKGGTSPINSEHYAELVAFDLLLNHLQEILGEIEVGLRGFEIDQETMDQFRSDLARVRGIIDEEKHSLHLRFMESLKAIEQTMQLEKKIQHSFSQMATKENP